MDQIEYNELLTKANLYFSQDRYNLFLDEFSKCYAYNADCFLDDVNVFKFSLSRYAQTSNATINEFNRFILHLENYLNTLESFKEKNAFIAKLKSLIDKKYNEVCLYDKIINYDNFNNYCAILMQLYKLLNIVISGNLISDKTIIDDMIVDIKGKIKQLHTVIKFTGTRFKVHFIYLPQKPKEFLDNLEKDVSLLI